MNELENLKDVLDSNILSGYKGSEDGNYGGKYCQRVEAQFRAYFGIKHALVMNSATSCLFVALRACGIMPNDMVASSPLTFSATSSAILSCGAVPYYVDIDRRTYNMRPEGVLPVKAIIPIHLMGYPCDMDRIAAHAERSGAKVIEDAAQAIGAKYKGKYAGTIGDCGVFSFNQGKQIQCGEGGVLLTNNDEVAYKASMLRNHGETQSNIMGFNFRMTELQAAVLSARFENIDETLATIRSICEYVSDELSGLNWLSVPYVEKGCSHSYMYYALRINGEFISRDEFQNRLAKQGIYFGIGGYKPLYLFPIYGKYKNVLPQVESAYKEMAFTNIFRPGITMERVKEVIKAIRAVV